MKGNMVKLDRKQMLVLKDLAEANGLKGTNTQAVDLAIGIAIKCIDKLDTETFENLTGLKHLNLDEL